MHTLSPTAARARIIRAVIISHFLTTVSITADFFTNRGLETARFKFWLTTTVYNFDTIDVDGKPEVAFKCLKRLVGERGFEPPTPWYRTRCSTRLSHSPTEVSPFILLHVTSHVLCSEIRKLGTIGTILL